MMFTLFMSLISTPSWINNLPESKEVIYSVGESNPTDQKEDALQKSWNSALIRIGISEFPELTQLSSKSTETLKNAEFERTAVQNFQLINWKGIHEMKTMGSPFIELDKQTKTFKVYRLLAWKKSDLKAAQEEARASLAKVKDSGEPVPTYKVPNSPENEQILENAINDNITYMQTVASNIDHINAKVAAVLAATKCGTQMSDLIHALGQPKHVTMGFGSQYVWTWGTFHVFSNNVGVDTFDQKFNDLARTDVIGFSSDLGREAAYMVCHPK